MNQGDILMIDIAREVSENGTRYKNDGNEALEEGTSPPLDLGPIEIIEVGEETLYNAEKDWEDHKQREIPKNMETDLTFSLQTRQKDRERPARKYNPD